MARQPKSRGERILNGNAGGRKLPGKVAVEPFDVDCPDWISKDAKEFWHSIVPELKKRKVVGATDVPALVILCQSWAEMKLATKTLEKEGRLYEGPNGAMCPHPAVRMQMNAMKAVNAFMEKFGLQPTTRARLPMQQPENKDNDSYSQFREE